MCVPCSRPGYMAVSVNTAVYAGREHGTHYPDNATNTTCVPVHTAVSENTVVYTAVYKGRITGRKPCTRTVYGPCTPAVLMGKTRKRGLSLRVTFIAAIMGSAFEAYTASRRMHFTCRLKMPVHAPAVCRQTCPGMSFPLKVALYMGYGPTSNICFLGSTQVQIPNVSKSLLICCSHKARLVTS